MTPLWEGRTWTCSSCAAVNATLRVRCRLCGIARSNEPTDEPGEGERRALIRRAQMPPDESTNYRQKSSDHRPRVSYESPWERLIEWIRRKVERVA